MSREIFVVSAETEEAFWRQQAEEEQITDQDEAYRTYSLLLSPCFEGHILGDNPEEVLLILWAFFAGTDQHGQDLEIPLNFHGERTYTAVAAQLDLPERVVTSTVKSVLRHLKVSTQGAEFAVVPDKRKVPLLPTALNSVSQSVPEISDSGLKARFFPENVFIPALEERELFTPKLEGYLNTTIREQIKELITLDYLHHAQNTYFWRYRDSTRENHFLNALFHPAQNPAIVSAWYDQIYSRLLCQQPPRELATLLSKSQTEATAKLQLQTMITEVVHAVAQDWTFNRSLMDYKTAKPYSDNIHDIPAEFDKNWSFVFWQVADREQIKQQILKLRPTAELQELQWHLLPYLFKNYWNICTPLPELNKPAVTELASKMLSSFSAYLDIFMGIRPSPHALSSMY